MLNISIPVHLPTSKQSSPLILGTLAKPLSWGGEMAGNLMDNIQKISLWISIFTLIASFVAVFFQYQSRQDSLEERLKIELKMVLQESPLSASDLRMISGDEERKSLEAAILVTNMGATTIRITEAGYEDIGLPRFVFHAGAKNSKVLSPGEQALFIAPGLVKIHRQLTDNILLGEVKNARIFATSTKGSNFEALAIVEVEH